MRGALIHGVLLVVMLVYGYRTWTRDKTVKPDLGSVVLWDKSEKDIVSIAYKGETREVKLEQKTTNGETYWWGSDTQITKQPKAPPKPPEPAPGAGSGSAAGSAAGSGAGSGSAAPPPTPGSGAAGSAGSAGSAAGSGAGSGSAKPPEPPKPPEMEEVRKTREFPLGENGNKIVKSYTAARAIRDLGVLDDAKKKTYKLDAPKSSITVTFKDGARTFQLGDAVYGNQDKYAIDDKGRGYVLSKDMLTNLELGEQSLFLADARGFDVKKIEAVEIEGAGMKKSGVRTTTDVDGRPVKTWADGATKKPHPSLGNFIDQLGALPPVEYSPKTKLESLTKILTVTYKDGDGTKLGALSLYKGPKAPPAAGETPPPGPKSDFDYFIMTEKSRVPAMVRADTAQQVETNLPVIMSEKPPEPGKSAVDPKGNPFGNAPLPTPGSGAPPMGNPHGGNPHGGDPHGAPHGAEVDDGHGHGVQTPPPAPTTPPAPAGGSAAKPAPAGGSAAKPAPAGGSAAKPAPAAPPAPKPAPSAPPASKPAAPAAGSAAAAGSAK